MKQIRLLIEECNPDAEWLGVAFIFTCSIINELPQAGFFSKRNYIIYQLIIKIMSKLGEYLKETKGELQHVSWPTKRQAVIFTVIVIVFSLVISIYLGALDFLFTMILKLFIK
ncbi:MAG: preprotein translocase subunit SecE [bacterium]